MRDPPRGQSSGKLSCSRGCPRSGVKLLPALTQHHNVLATTLPRSVCRRRCELFARVPVRPTSSDHLPSIGHTGLRSNLDHDSVNRVPPVSSEYTRTMSDTTPIPFSEPPYLSGLPSPYYKPTHLKWQKACRAFVDEHLHQYAMEWEREETVPEHVFRIFAKANMLIPNLPAPLPVAWLKRLGINDILGTPIDEWDYLHTGIYLDEMSRSGLSGPGSSMTVGIAFGVPPILKFGTEALQEKFLPDLLTGKKRACIAITEPGAGSDVANIQTTATKSSDGKHYIVNGIILSPPPDPLPPSPTNPIAQERRNG